MSKITMATFSVLHPEFDIPNIKQWIRRMPDEPILEEIILNNESSCSKDQAIAKLLGWMRGPIRKKVIRLTEVGNIHPDDLPFVDDFEASEPQMRLAI